MPARPNPPLIAARSFEAAARHRSFQSAAAELNVTPTAVSHQVRKLEEFLGLELFVRHNRAVELTEAGQRLARELGPLFVALEQALDPRAVAGEREPLRISAMPSLAAKWLAPRLPDFEAQHPDIRVELKDEDALLDFRDRRADVALRYGPGRYAEMTSLPWMAAPIFPVCSPAMAARLSEPGDLCREVLIHDETPRLPGSPPDWSAWLRQAGVAHPAPAAGPRFSSVYVALEAAKSGRGVALAPGPLAVDDLENGSLVRPFALALDNPCAFWIVHPAHQEPDDRLATLIGWLRRAADGHFVHA